MSVRQAALSCRNIMSVLGPVSWKPWKQLKLFGTTKPYLKTERRTRRMNLLSTFVHIKNMWMKQLCNHKVLDLITAKRLWGLLLRLTGSKNLSTFISKWKTNFPDLYRIKFARLPAVWISLIWLDAAKPPRKKARNTERSIAEKFSCWWWSPS